tara:strand:- start:146 stop:853 length:708 start_codon:yes stop_codon:yes gene_type:complete
MSGKLPAIMFYPGDWMKDPALRATSLFARGLWIDLLCLMHESPRRGYLLLKTGKPMGFKQISRVTGVSLREATNLTQELIDNGVCSVDGDGVLYSRRMIRDEEVRLRKRLAGQRGGRMRVANERQARRTTDEGRNVDKDGDVLVVWKALPSRLRRSKPQTLLAASDAIDRVTQAQGIERPEAAKAIAKQLTRYYDSEEGTSQFHRSPERWLDEDGFEEPVESWSSRQSSTEKAFH